MDVLDDKITFTFTIHVVIGVILLAISAFARFTAIQELGTWRGIFNPILPSLTGSQSPAARTRAGIMGCITGVFANMLCLVCLILGIDQLVLAGSFFEWLLVLLRIQ